MAHVSMGIGEILAECEAGLKDVAKITCRISIVSLEQRSVDVIVSAPLAFEEASKHYLPHPAK
jgi:hypothetical protein